MKSSYIYYIQLAAFFALVLESVGCVPSGRVPTCEIRNVLPRLTPVGAIDCGDLDVPWVNSPSNLDRRVVCANDAIGAQSPFVLRLPGVVPNPACQGGRGFCGGLIGVRGAFVGSLVNGRYRVIHYRDGDTHPHTDSTQDSGVVDAGPGDYPLTVVRQECEPDPLARLHIVSPNTAVLSILCPVNGGTDSTEIVTLPRVESCPAP